MTMPEYYREMTTLSCRRNSDHRGCHNTRSMTHYFILVAANDILQFSRLTSSTIDFLIADSVTPTADYLKAFNSHFQPQSTDVLLWLGTTCKPDQGFLPTQTLGHQFA